MALIFQVWVNASVLGGSWEKTFSSETRVDVNVAYVRALCALPYDWRKLETRNGTSRSSRFVILFPSEFTLGANQVSDECSCGSRESGKREWGVVRWRWVIVRNCFWKNKEQQQLYKMLLFRVSLSQVIISKSDENLLSLYSINVLLPRQATRRKKIIN